MGWLAGLWRDVLAAPVDGPEADFFALGGGSLSAAQLVAALRQRYPQVTVADLYDHPRLGSLAGFLDELDPPPQVETRVVRPMPLLSQAFQVAMSLPLATLTGLQWVVWLALINNVAATSEPGAVAGAHRLVVDPRRVPAVRHPAGADGHRGAFGARMLIGFLKPGTYRRGGSVHLRVWLAERLADASGAENLAGAPWMVYYARALGNKVGKGVDLHSAPPVTGMLTLGHRSSIEPEVDLSGHWIDGDHFHVGTITIGNDATIGARTTLLPGAAVGKNADVAAGLGRGRPGEEGPVLEGFARGEVRQGPPSLAGGTPGTGAVLGAGVRGDLDAVGRLALAALGCGLAVIGWAIRDSASLTDAIVPALVWTPVATLVALVVYASLTVVGVRVMSLWLREGYHPVRSRSAGRYGRPNG